MTLDASHLRFGAKQKRLRFPEAFSNYVTGSRLVGLAATVVPVAVDLLGDAILLTGHLRALLRCQGVTVGRAIVAHFAIDGSVLLLEVRGPTSGQLPLLMPCAMRSC